MNLNLKIRLSDEDHPWLCFKHAVELSMEGKNIILDIDDYDSEYYMGTKYCVCCNGESK